MHPYSLSIRDICCRSSVRQVNDTLAASIGQSLELIDVLEDSDRPWVVRPIGLKRNDQNRSRSVSSGSQTPFEIY